MLALFLTLLLVKPETNNTIGILCSVLHYSTKMSAFGVTNRRRPEFLDREALGDDYSVNLAFLKCIDDSPLVYTMLEMKKTFNNGSKLRNCQGGWVEDCDQDAFATAAREACEEICPPSEISLQWQYDVADKLRQLYNTVDPSLSVYMYQMMKTDPKSKQKVLKTHVSIRVILPSDDPLYSNILIEKDIGSPVGGTNEATGDLKWEELAHINQSSEHFHFSFSCDDINCNSLTFNPRVRYIDERYFDKTISCRMCKTSFVHSAENQCYFKTKGFEDPKNCNMCKNVKKTSYNNR
jgi:hypothetical protein